MGLLYLYLYLYFILKNKSKLIVVVNSVLRRIIFSRRNDVRGKWRFEMGGTYNMYEGEYWFIQRFGRNT